MVANAFVILFLMALCVWALFIGPMFLETGWSGPIILTMLLLVALVTAAVALPAPSWGQTVQEQVQEQQREGYAKGLALMRGDWVLACQAYNLAGGQKYLCTQLGWTKPFYETEAECSRTKEKLQSVVAAKAPSWHVVALCYQRKK